TTCTIQATTATTRNGRMARNRPQKPRALSMGTSTKVWILRAGFLLNFAFGTSVAVADAPLRPGDQIEMKVGGVPTTEISAFSGIYTIDGEGSVNLPHTGRVN